MVVVRFPAMKSGINPSNKTAINPEKLTPSQKVMFTRNRIWGNVIGGNLNSGYSTMSKPLKGEKMVSYYELSYIKMIFPFVDNLETRNKSKLKFEDRKKRIFMRGIKIGNKRKGTTDKGMALFTQGAKSKDIEYVDTQGYVESDVKDRMQMSDDYLKL